MIRKRKKMIDVFGTVGPSCDEEQVLADMLREGMTGVRINLSHTGLKESADTFRRLHHAFAAVGKDPSILIDMQGPEMRIGVLPRSLVLEDGDCAVLQLQTSLSVKQSVEEAPPSVKQSAEEVPPSVKQSSGTVPTQEIPVAEVILRLLSPGKEVRLDDGRILLRILRADGNRAEAEVLRGGTLTSRKSIAVEGVESALPALTDEDICNIRQAPAYGVTGLMQPFVRSGEDIRYVRRILREQGAGKIRIYAKIENLQGIRELPGIAEEADEIIIARGDLGNAMPLWELPARQMDIAGFCLRRGIPFMVVTQMLSSMEHSRVPTRAEVSDIFHAVTDGAASVMVTGETAVGEYPVEVIRYLARTCRAAEDYRNGRM